MTDPIDLSDTEYMMPHEAWMARNGMRLTGGLDADGVWRPLEKIDLAKVSAARERCWEEHEVIFNSNCYPDSINAWNEWAWDFLPIVGELATAAAVIPSMLDELERAMGLLPLPDGAERKRAIRKILERFEGWPPRGA